MEKYASYQDSREVLEELGFVPLSDAADETVFDSPGEDWVGSVIQVQLYQCRNNYWCVDADNGFMAPIVWNGPRADWDDSDTKMEFTKWLDKNHPGWK